MDGLFTRLRVRDGAAFEWPTRSSHCLASRRSAFTLIEVLAVVAVLAILVAITVPALRGARSQADVSKCMSGLKQALLLHASASASNGGTWANLLGPGDEPKFFDPHGFTVASALYADTVVDNVTGWHYALGNAVTGGHELEFNEGVSCPIVLSYFLSQPESGTVAGSWLTSYPGEASVFSFRYSLALVTRAELWDPALTPEERSNPDDFRKRVGVHEVKTPSGKVALYEPADWHGKDGIFAPPHEAASAPPSSKANVGFCDGHVARVRVRDAVAPLAAPWWGTVWGPGAHAVPSPRGVYFSSAPWGYRGRDF
ncbi:MAG: type II secretion system protein [Phycisphaerales bacterium]|nr:type II secretion system protein [Phycisphaerales bacterium]